MKKIPIPEGTQTRFFYMGENILGEVHACLAEAFPGKTPWIVADENTWKAAGEETARQLQIAGVSCHKPFIFPGHPIMHASEALARQVADAMPEGCVPLAIGSGTINDLVKRASGLKNVPYCCLGTACSVDGYTSSGAALLVDGLKKTMPCPPPYAVIADTAVLSAAPKPMFAGGYADLLAKIYGGADWIIADETGIEAIDKAVWSLTQDHLREWLSDSSNFFNIFQGLCCTGYGMQLYHESRPASGAEHLFSHIWEMEKLRFNGESVSHGFQVGIGMLLSAQLMEFIVDHSREQAEKLAQPFATRAERREEIGRLLVRGCYGSAAETAEEKFLEGEAAVARRKLIFDHWETLRERIRRQFMTADELRSILRKSGCPACHREIGLSDEQFLHAVPAAQLIRKRYTCLDLLYEAGLLSAAVDRIAASL